MNELDELTNEEREKVLDYINTLKMNRKSWLESESQEYADIHYDDELCYYVGFDETEDVDIRPLLIDCYRDAIYNFKNKLLEESKKFNIKEREITNRINVIALEEIMNNLLRL